MTIRARLFTFVILLSILLIGVSYFATFITMDILSKTEHIYQDQFLELENLFQQERIFSRTDDALRDFFNHRSGDPETGSKESGKSLKSILPDLGEEINVSADDPLKEEFLTAYADWQMAVAELYPLLDSGRTAEGRDVFSETYQYASKTLEASFTAQKETIGRRAEENYWNVREYGKKLFITYHVIAASGGDWASSFFLLSTGRS